MRYQTLPNFTIPGISIILALFFLASCGGSGSNVVVQPPPDFTPSISPSSISFLPGTTSSPVKVSITGVNGFTGTVSVVSSGLPTGVTSSPSLPFNLSAGSSQDVTFTSSLSSVGDFPVSFQFTSGSISILVDTTLEIDYPPNIGNRSTFVRLDSPMTPGTANYSIHRQVVYDATHKQVFVTNEFLGRVDVLSSLNGAYIADIPVAQPSGLDISPDGTRVYVATYAEEIDAIDPATLRVVQRFPVPCQNPTPVCYSIPVALTMTSNSTALLTMGFLNNSLTTLVNWDIATNTYSVLMLTPSVTVAGSTARSADFSKVIIVSNPDIFVYDVATNSITAQANYTGLQAPIVAVGANPNGTQFEVMADFSESFQGVIFLDAQLNELKRIPSLSGRIPTSLVYSRDGQFFYFPDTGGNEVSPTTPVIRIFNALTFQEIGQVPDIAPLSGDGFPYTSIIEDIDETGMIFATNWNGVTFLDASHASTLPSPGPLITLLNEANQTLTPPQGPSSGGTAVELLGSNFGSAGRVFLGNQEATNVGVGSGGLTFTSPASSPGPANFIAYLNNGWFTFAPDGFNYGPTILAVSGTAGRPEGGDAFEIYGYGFGNSASGITVTIGGANAAVVELLDTTQTLSELTEQIPAPGPFPYQRLSIVTPSGSPGPADIVVSNAFGTTKSAGAFHYLKSLRVFPHSGTFKFLTYDRRRQRIYMSNSAEIEVFDIGSLQYLEPLIPPLGPLANSDLRQSSLTPDGLKLVVADAGALAIHIFDLTAGTAVSVPIPPRVDGLRPTRVVTTNTGLAFTGTNWVDLSTLMVTNSQIGGSLLSTDAAGDLICLNGTAAYNVSTNTVVATSVTGFSGGDAAVSADGNIFVAGGGGTGGSVPNFVFDLNLRMVNFLTYRDFLFGTGVAGRSPRLDYVPGLAVHPSGSLVYQPQELYLGSVGATPLPEAGGVDLLDVHDTRLRERVIFSEPMLDAYNGSAGSFLTIDENGGKLFALTQSGLTIAELSVVPLSIGSIQPSQGTSSGGVLVTIRGSGIQPGATVIFGNAQVASTVVDVNTVTFTTPAGSPGAVRITILNPDGSNYSLDAAYVEN